MPSRRGAGAFLNKSEVDPTEGLGTAQAGVRKHAAALEAEGFDGDERQTFVAVASGANMDFDRPRPGAERRGAFENASHRDAGVFLDARSKS